MDTTGIAAVDELDALLTRDDFEGDVDTDLLDVTLAALRDARAAIAALEALRDSLAAGSVDAVLTAGLATDARLAVEQLDAVTAGALA